MCVIVVALVIHGLLYRNAVFFLHVIACETDVSQLGAFNLAIDLPRLF